MDRLVIGGGTVLTGEFDDFDGGHCYAGHDKKLAQHPDDRSDRFFGVFQHLPRVGCQAHRKHPDHQSLNCNFETSKTGKPNSALLTMFLIFLIIFLSQGMCISVLQ